MYLASDHGGFQLKEQVKQVLDKQGIRYKDLGPHQLITDDDYPDYIFPLAESVARTDSQGIISCRNGQGVAIAANKVPGVRAVVCWNEACARSARNDDNSNILSLPADYITELEAEKIVLAWLETPFSQDARHLRRLKKVREYEKEISKSL